MAIDVIRATTTAITGVALGRQCFPVPSIEKATSLANKLINPLLAGELGGNMPFGFDMQNSPAELDSRADLDRPMILLSTSGTRLISEFREAEATYVACFRNYGRLIYHLQQHHATIALIGAGTRGEFREEDQLCCAWIADGLFQQGYQPEDEETLNLVDRWKGVSVNAIREGKSADYLCRSGQEKDLDFVLTHINDLDRVYIFRDGQVVEHSVA